MQTRRRQLSGPESLLPHRDLKKYPRVKQAIELLFLYANANTPEDLMSWLNLKIPIIGDEGRCQIAAKSLLETAKEYPETFFGFYDDQGKFIPGYISLIAHKKILRDQFTDPLDNILSMRILSGMKVDQVVALAKKQGYSTNSETVRKRVQDWDRG
jgi:hypothetical protein